MLWLYQFVLLTVLTVMETVCPKIWAKLLPKLWKSISLWRARWRCYDIARHDKFLGDLTKDFGRNDSRATGPQTYQGNGSKKLEFQLVLWASNSHILLSKGHFLLVLVYVFVRGWLSWGKWALKITCAATRKSTCPRLLDENFSESCSLRSSSLSTYSCRCLLAKSKTYSLGGASLKER